jgi:hypothetical protein
MASVGVCFCGGREYSGDCVGPQQRERERRKKEGSLQLDFNYFRVHGNAFSDSPPENGGSQMACGLPPDLPGASPSILHHNLLVCAIVGRVVCVVAVSC